MPWFRYHAPVTDRAIIPSLCSRRWWALVGATAVLLVVWAAPWAVRREVAFALDAARAGECWELAWTRGGVRNGCWLDLAELHAQRGPLEIVRRVGSPGLAQIEVAWHDAPAGASARVRGPRLRTWVLGRMVEEERLVVLGVIGSAWSPESEGAALSDMKPQGAVLLSAPPPRAGAVLGLFVLAVPSAAGLWCLPGLLGAIGRVLGAWAPLARGLGPRPTRVIAALCVLAMVGVPAWLLWWSPMIVCGDGTAYLWLAELVWRTGGFSHLDGWRLPGYAMTLVPILAAGGRVLGPLGVVQALMGVSTAWGVLVLLRSRFVGAHAWVAWAGAGMVAVDAWVQVWQRLVLSEAQTTLLAVWAAVLCVRVMDRVDGPARPGLRAWVWAAGLGVVLAMASLTRANMQVLGVLMPLGLAWGACRSGVGGWRRLGPSVVCGVVAAAGVAPLVLFNHAHYGRAAVTVGTDWNRLLWLWDQGRVDWNQSGSISFAHFRELRGRCEARTIDAWGVTDLLQAWREPPAADGPSAWTERDERCGAFWRESESRGRGTPDAIGRGALAQLGLVAAVPGRELGELRALTAPLVSGDGVVNGTNWQDRIERFPMDIRPVLERTVTPLGDGPRSASARVLGMGLAASGWAHQVLAVLFLAGLVRLWGGGGKRDGAALVLGLVVVAHALAVPMVTFSQNPRYSMPLWPLVIAGTLIAWGPARERRP